jgi:hypothetical protein
MNEFTAANNLRAYISTLEGQTFKFAKWQLNSPATSRLRTLPVR